MSKEEKYYSFQDILEVIGFNYEFYKITRYIHLIKIKIAFDFLGDRLLYLNMEFLKW